MKLEKGNRRAAACGLLASCALGVVLGAGTEAWAKTTPFSAGQFATATHDVSGRGGEFSENISIRSLRLGDRTLRFDNGGLRAPVQVRVASGDAAPSCLTEAGMLALTPDLPSVPGMTALDAFCGADLGRMVSTDASSGTCVQVYLATKEHDDDGFTDDAWPELLLIGAANGTSVQVTPILDGTPDLPDSLVFGRPHTVSAEAFAKGLMPLRMDYTGRKAPQAMAAVGLDLSGDLGVAPGQTVVGYQIDVPAGASMPLKVIAAGQIEFGALANYADTSFGIPSISLAQMGPANPVDRAEDSMTSVVGPVFLLSGNSATTDGAADVARMTQPAGPSFNLPEPSGFAPTGSVPTPPTVPPTPIPAPGVAVLLGTATSVLLNRRRRS